MRLRISISVGFLLLVALLGWRHHGTQEKAVPQGERVKPEMATATLVSTEGRLASGETPMGWALRSGIARGEAKAILDALSSYLPASRYRTDDRLTVLRDGGGRVVQFEVERRDRERIVVKEQPGGNWVAFPERKALRRKVAHFRGTIQSSLWESVLGVGAPAELVLRFADIFAWTFDFLSDCRRGDHFDFLVEQLYDGEELIGYGKILVARYEGERGSVEGVRYQLADGKSSYFAPDGRSLQKIFLKSPLSYRRISSRFTRSRFHPILKKRRPHLGIDYAAATGAPVVTVGDGVVTRAGRNGGFGHYVEVKHNRAYTTTYGHLSRYGKGIRRGVRVSQGEVIGYVGSTGLATGPHLDFRMKRRGKYVDPLSVNIPSADPVPASERRSFFHVSKIYLAALDLVPEGVYSVRDHPMALSLLAGPRSGFLTLAPAIGDQPVP